VGGGFAVEHHRAVDRFHHRTLLCRWGGEFFRTSLAGSEDEDEEAQDERHEQGKGLLALQIYQADGPIQA
jgi:hypothetical protein